MNNFQIETFLRTNKYTKPYFFGVFACDTLPFRIPKVNQHLLIICNTDKSTGPGQHWIGIHFSADNVATYFDSFGMYPQNLYISNFLKRNASKITTNNKMIQSVFSRYCGHFCALFLYFMVRGKSLNKIVGMFKNKNLKENDILVRRLIDNIYCKNECTKPICKTIF